MTIIKGQPQLDEFDESRKDRMKCFKDEAKECLRLDVLKAIEDSKPEHGEYLRNLYKRFL